MDLGQESLTRWIEWITQRSGRPLFLIGVLLFFAGFVGWLVPAIRRRSFQGDRDASSVMDSSHPKILADRILESTVCPCVILMASEQYDSLSVTIPVRTAMELVRRKKRCLLVDLDLPRNAIARAFELESLPAIDSPRPIQTPFKDLHIWPGDYFDGKWSIPLSQVIAAATEIYDVVLLYAPVLHHSVHLQAAASVSQWAFVFHPAGSCSEDLRLALQMGGAVLFDVPSESSPISPQSANIRKKKIVEIKIGGQNCGTSREAATVDQTDKQN